MKTDRNHNVMKFWNTGDEEVKEKFLEVREASYN